MGCEKSIEHAITSAYAYRNPDSNEDLYDSHREIFGTDDILPVDFVQQTVDNIGKGILERNLEKGNEIEIPRLDIVIKKRIKSLNYFFLKLYGY